MILGEKFSISCRKENFVEVQCLLFSNGYFWNGENKTEIISSGIFEEYDIIHLSNYGSGESGNWIIGNRFVHSKYFDEDDNVTVYSDLQLLRRFKLENLGKSSLSGKKLKKIGSRL